MTLMYAIVALLAATAAVFAMQNSAPTRVSFLVWSTADFPLSLLVLLALAVGIVLGGVPLWIQRWRLRSRTRTLEARVASLEQRLAEREPPPRPDHGVMTSP